MFATNNRTPIINGYYQATVNGTAQTILQLCGLTFLPKGTNVCLIQVEHDNTLTSDNLAVRYREDTGTPTADLGFIMELGGYREFTNKEQIADTKIISADSGNSVKINIQFYKGN